MADPVARSLASAPVDDEPLATEEIQAAITKKKLMHGSHASQFQLYFVSYPFDCGGHNSSQIVFRS